MQLKQLKFCLVSELCCVRGIKTNLLKMHALPLNCLGSFAESRHRTGFAPWKARLTEFIKMLIIKQARGALGWDTIRVKTSQCRKCFNCLVLHLDCRERSFHCTSTTLFYSLCKLLGSAAKILKAAFVGSRGHIRDLIKVEVKALSLFPPSLFFFFLQQ